MHKSTKWRMDVIETVCACVAIIVSLSCVYCFGICSTIITKKYYFNWKSREREEKRRCVRVFKLALEIFVIFTSSNMMHWFHSWIGCDAIINTRNLCGNSCKTHDPFAFTSSNPFIVSFIWQMCARLCGCN